MKIRWMALLAPAAVLLLIYGCGDGDNTPATPNSAAFINFSTTFSNPDYQLTLANGLDTATLKAIVRQSDGTLVPDGTPVTFSVPAGTAVFGNSANILSTTTVAGRAQAALSHPAITSGTNVISTATAVSGSASGMSSVKFINTPATATVTVALTSAVNDLGIFAFRLTNGAGSTYASIQSINEASVANLVLPNLAAPDFILLHAGAPPINTVADSPIIQLGYTITGGITALPSFTIDTTAGTFTLANSAGVDLPHSAADTRVGVVFDTE